jgi:hypothetical protein
MFPKIFLGRGTTRWAYTTETLLLYLRVVQSIAMLAEPGGRRANGYTLRSGTW